MITTTPEICVKSLSNDITVEALKTDFDYIIMSMYFTTCYLGYVHEKKVPLIYVSPNVLTDPFSNRIGAVEFPSINPNIIFPIVYPLSFLERVYSTAGSIAFTLLNDYIDILNENLCRQMGLWKPEIPPVRELQTYASLAIINSIKALEIPSKPSPPNVIYAGGIHIHQPKPLSKELRNWFDESGEGGFILFSLGTAVRPADMQEEHLQILIKVFRSLPQRIIWKWDSKEIKNLPPNVLLKSWLPQQGILAHPKIRLFITHGGLFSIQEATYYGVPVIGMPVFGDQQANVAEVIAEDWGRRITWKELTEEKFRDVVTETLMNSSLRQNVIRRSKLMKDWPRNPSDEVVYWTEYVVRHNGAKHLLSPVSRTPWYILYNVDAWFFIIAVLAISLLCTLMILKLCVSCLGRKLFKVKKD